MKKTIRSNQTIKQSARGSRHVVRLSAAKADRTCASKSRGFASIQSAEYGEQTW